MHSFTKLIAKSILLLMLVWGLGGRPVGAQVLHNTFAGGGGHSLSIHDDGTLWATGLNDNGQLGDNTTTSHLGWVQIGTATDWVQVAAGQSFSLGLRANGQLYAWGVNDNGQLGDGTTTARPVPTLVAGTYTQVAAGLYHCLALRADGSLWAWGDNSSGEVGDNTTVMRLVPTAVGGGPYTQIAAGFYHSLALRPDGSLWAWGLGNSGQLGIGTNFSQRVPTAVAGGHTFVQVAAGSFFSYGLRNDGHIYSWGNNNLGQLGNGGTADGLVPAPIAGGQVYSQVSAGRYHGLGLRASGTLEAWGYNGQGQIGNNTLTTTTEPTLVFGNATYVQAIGGQNHSLALRADGTLWAWGSNSGGQLGDGTTNNRYVPATSGLALPTRSTAAGSNFGLAIRGDGSLWSWGDNTSGQLGDGTTQAHVRPAQAGTSHEWVQVVAGGHHALALRSNGSLWTWGDNSLGQLGTATNAGTTTPAVTPTLVSAGPYVQLAAGEAYSLALQADGSLWAWGDNSLGQLGTATNAGTAVPNPGLTQVPGRYAQVAAGATHALALQANGQLYTWGANSSGQLGSPATTTPNPAPTALGSTPYTRVAAGEAHSLALQADGSLWAWGDNTFGQLGNTTNLGTPAANPTPALVPGQYAQVAAGQHHSLALRAGGTLWAWGANDSGQLGTGAAAPAVGTPTQEATGAASWTTLAPGPRSNTSLVRSPSAENFASAGQNGSGQLGDGTTTNAERFDRLSPLLSLQPLPVVLVSFAAQRTGPATVALAWATASEQGNAGFTVEKSTDGVAFAPLGFVAGAGTSSAAHAYAFTDAQAPARSYYRLTQHDADGTGHYSPVVVVAGAAMGLVLAPNPAHGVVQIAGLAPDATLVVYDELGRAVRPAAATLNVAGLPAGVYLVRATAPHQAPQTARLVVE